MERALLMQPELLCLWGSKTILFPLWGSSQGLSLSHRWPWGYIFLLQEVGWPPEVSPCHPRDINPGGRNSCQLPSPGNSHILHLSTCPSRTFVSGIEFLCKVLRISFAESSSRFLLPTAVINSSMGASDNWNQLHVICIFQFPHSCQSDFFPLHISCLLIFFFHVSHIWSNFFFPFPISENNVNLEKRGQTCVLFLAKFPLLNWNSVTTNKEK